MWKERNRIVFDNEEFSVHRLKYSFVCSLWSWTRLYIDVSSYFALFCLLAPIVYFLYALGCFPNFLFLINILSTVFIHQKKKNLVNFGFLIEAYK